MIVAAVARRDIPVAEWVVGAILAAITGHQAGDSAAADARCVALAVDQLRAYAAGRPLKNVVR